MSLPIITRQWFRLDNSAAIYPMVITVSTQSLFRLSAELCDHIDKDDLLEAAERTFQRYPYYAVELKGGFFRYSLARNFRKFVVREDDGCHLKKINFIKNRGYLIRITYYKRKIFVDFFHGLCDGMAAMEFMKTLLYNYLTVRGEDIDSGGMIKIHPKEIEEAEVSDGFAENFGKINIKEGAKKMAGAPAFRLTGKLFRKEGYGVIEGTMESDSLKALAKSYNCSITVFLAAHALLSIAKATVKDSRRDYSIFIPVNLRNYFPSGTMLNFTTITKHRVPQDTELKLEKYIEIISASLKEQLNKDDLRMKLSFTSLFEKNPFLRFLPLPVKSFFARAGRFFSLNTRQTIILSNVGEIKLPKEMNGQVDALSFNLNCSRKTPNNIAMLSYNGKTVISFTRQLVSTEIEREFFTGLAKMGVNVKIASNLREVKI